MAPSWPTKADFQSSEQTKDKVKYVSPNMTCTEDPNTPSHMERALEYIRIHGSSNPNLHKLFQNWSDDDKNICFEEYAKTATMLRVLPITKKA